MGSRRPQEGRRNQMQNKHERFWEEAQPQVGVWAAWAVYGVSNSLRPHVP